MKEMEYYFTKCTLYRKLLQTQAWIFLRRAFHIMSKFYVVSRFEKNNGSFWASYKVLVTFHRYGSE